MSALNDSLQGDVEGIDYWLIGVCCSTSLIILTIMGAVYYLTTTKAERKKATDEKGVWGIVAVVPIVTAFFLIILGFAALNHSDYLISVAVWLMAMVIILIIYAIVRMQKTPDTPSEPSKLPIVQPRPKRPPTAPRPEPPSHTASAIARSRPKVGKPVLVFTPEGREEKGWAIQVRYGVVKVMMADGSIEEFDEEYCTMMD